MDADGDEKIGGLLAKLDAVAADVEGSTLKSPGKPPVVKLGFKILGRFSWKLFMLRLVLKIVKPENFLLYLMRISWILDD